MPQKPSCGGQPTSPYGVPSGQNVTSAPSCGQIDASRPRNYMRSDAASQGGGWWQACRHGWWRGDSTARRPRAGCATSSTASAAAPLQPCRLRRRRRQRLDARAQPRARLARELVLVGVEISDVRVGDGERREQLEIKRVRNLWREFQSFLLRQVRYSQSGSLPCVAAAAVHRRPRRRAPRRTTTLDRRRRHARPRPRLLPQGRRPPPRLRERVRRGVSAADPTGRGERDVRGRVHVRRGGRELARARTLPSSSRLGALAEAADTLVWQTLASVAIPGFTINRIVWASQRITTPPSVWAPTVCGLAAIPLIVDPIDHGVDVFMERVYRPLLRPNRTRTKAA